METKNHWFDWLQIAVLLAAAPLFIFPKPHLWPAFLVLPILSFVSFSIKKEWIPQTPLDWPMGILLVALAATVFRVTDFSHSLPKIAGLLFGIWFFYSLVNLIKTEKLFKLSIIFYLAGGVGFSIIGLLGMPTFTGKHLYILKKVKEQIPRVDFNLTGAESGFATNAVGGVLVLIVPLFILLLILIAYQKKKILIGLIGSGLLITSFVLLMTQSRGAMAGVILAGAIMGSLLLLKYVTPKKRIIAVSLFLIALVATIGIGISSVTGTSQLTPGLKQVQGTFLFRVQLWDLALPVIKENPAWGLGLNNFRMIPEVRYFLSHPHNQFLHVAVELGIPALIAYLSLLILTGFMCVNAWRKAENRLIRFGIFGLGMGQMAFGFFGLTDAIPLGSKVGIFFWVSLALITSAYRLFLSGQANDFSTTHGVTTHGVNTHGVNTHRVKDSSTDPCILNSPSNYAFGDQKSFREKVSGLPKAFDFPPIRPIDPIILYENR